ncbi:MAG: 4-hydroxybutyrate dehydrogenase [Christensenellales bacterium]|jgi:4-hydroxybutyrate dehydrogenase
MRELIIKPQIHRYGVFKEFADGFELDGNDLIFTEKFIYDTFIKGLDLPCKVLLRDAHGLGEPSDDMIDDIAREAAAYDFKRLIAVGGGSVIDIAKILVLEDCIPSIRIFSKEIPARREKGLVIIPTTCGTGSEMTNLSIANIVSKGTKLGIGDECMYADHAVLIPTLVEGLPHKFFLFSSIDALVHAAESYVSPKANVFTDMMAIKACDMLLNGFVKMYLEGPEIKKDLAGDFLTASCIAGAAFANAGVGPVHALAYPLGGNYHVPHGETNYQFFAQVFNLYKNEKPGGKIDEIATLIRGYLDKAGIESTDENVFEKLEEMLGRLEPLKSLREYGMKEEEIDVFAQSVMDNQQRLLVNSYVPFTLEHARMIYKNRY